MAKVHSCQKLQPSEQGARTIQTTDDRQTGRRICDSKEPDVTSSRLGKNVRLGLYGAKHAKCDRMMTDDTGL